VGGVCSLLLEPEQHAAGRRLRAEPHRRADPGSHGALAVRARAQHHTPQSPFILIWLFLVCHSLEVVLICLL
jgi:hypothetical protein